MSSPIPIMSFPESPGPVVSNQTEIPVGNGLYLQVPHILQTEPWDRRKDVTRYGFDNAAWNDVFAPLTKSRIVMDDFGVQFSLGKLADIKPDSHGIYWVDGNVIDGLAPLFQELHQNPMMHSDWRLNHLPGKIKQNSPNVRAGLIACLVLACAAMGYAAYRTIQSPQPAPHRQIEPDKKGTENPPAEKSEMPDTNPSKTGIAGSAMTIQTLRAITGMVR